MSARFAVLLALVAVALTVVYVNLDHPGVPVTPGALPERDMAPGEEAAELARPHETTVVGAREAVTSKEERARRGAQDSTASHRELEGRVELPDGTPFDESVRVRIKSTRFELLTVEVEHDGSFRARLPRAGRVTFSLVASHVYLEQSLAVQLEEVEGPVRLQALLGGRVLAEVDAPDGHGADELDEVEVKLEGFRDGGRRIERTGVALADGRYAFDGLPTGILYRVHVSSDAFADQKREGVRVFGGETTELELPLLAGARIEGTVVGPDGAPVFEARVYSQRRNPVTGITRWVDQVTTRTDETGRFVLRGIVPGEIRVTATAEDAEDAREELGELADGYVRTDLPIRLGGGESVGGVVQWSDGSPAKDVRVRVVRENDPWSQGATQKTDADGHFSCSGLSGGPYAVLARGREDAASEWWRAREVGVVGGAADLLLVLELGDRISGGVVDDRGEPLDRFTVRARPLDAALSRRAKGEVKERFRKAEGSFELAGLGEGAWDVRIEARGHADAPWQRVSMPEGAGELGFVLHRTAGVSGHVRHPGGAPADGAKVVATSPDGEDVSTRSDEDGAFRLKNLVPGELELTAEADGRQASLSLSVELFPAEERAGLELRLRGGARLVGRIDPSIDDYAERKILASPVGTYEFHTTLCDADGSFVFEGLSAGSWRVGFDWRSSGGAGEDWVAGYQKRAEENVELIEGETTEVVLGGPHERAVRVVGTVARDGEPLADQIVYVFPPADPAASPVNIARSDAEGGFSFELPGPGSYRFTAGRDQGHQVPFLRDVPEEPEVRVDLELPSAVLAGRVVRPDGSPAARQPLMFVPVDAPAGSRALGDMQMAFTDSEGTFRLEGVPTGAFFLRTGGWGLDNNGLGVRVLDGFELAEGEELVDLVIELASAGVVEGGVLGPDGLPAQGVTVRLVDAEDRDLFIWSSEETDYTGSFRFADVGEGELRVLAEAPDGSSAEEPIRVRPGGVMRVVLELTR